MQAKLKRLKLAAAAAELSEAEDPLAVRSLPRVRAHLTAEARTRQLQDRLGDQGWDRYSLNSSGVEAAGAHALLVSWLCLPNTSRLCDVIMKLWVCSLVCWQDRALFEVQQIQKPAPVNG